MNSEENECIICMSNTNNDNDKLIKNTYCKCKLLWHISCWDKYLKSTENPKCPTCRIPINPLQEPLINQNHTLLEQNTNILEQIQHISIIINQLQETINNNEITQEHIENHTQEQEQRQLFSELSSNEKKKRMIISFILLIICGIVSFGIFKIVE
jgi:hypothetical protein